MDLDIEQVLLLNERGYSVRTRLIGCVYVVALRQRDRPVGLFSDTSLTAAMARACKVAERRVA